MGLHTFIGQYQKPKQISLLTNDMELDPNDIILIYRKRWEIELLFKQLKQNFPLRYFYGESENAIKTQILDYLDSQLTAQCDAKRIETFVELFGLCYNGQNNPDVLCRLL